jgi:pyruvate/2-oxoglutarate dehydrogenase complex dihydrolipoamide dehydrogenase (E3) component
MTDEHCDLVVIGSGPAGQKGLLKNSENRSLWSRLGMLL